MAHTCHELPAYYSFRADSTFPFLFFEVPGRTSSLKGITDFTSFRTGWDGPSPEIWSLWDWIQLRDAHHKNTHLWMHFKIFLGLPAPFFPLDIVSRESSRSGHGTTWLSCTSTIPSPVFPSGFHNMDQKEGELITHRSNLILVTSPVVKLTLLRRQVSLVS